MFLGATLNAINTAKSYGFKEAKSAQYNTKNMFETFSVMSQQISNARQGQEMAINKEERKKIAK